MQVVNEGSGSLVVKKLCSTLTTYFLRSPVPWNNPLVQVLFSLAAGRLIDDSEIPTLEVSAALPQLGSDQLNAVLWFSGTLADEVGRMENVTPAHARVHEQMESIVKDAGALMDYVLQLPQNQTSTAVREEALKSFLTWVNYAQPMWPVRPEPLSYLRNVVERAAHCLTEPELQSVALDVFRDILESYTSFFLPQHMDLLAQIIATHIGPALEQALASQDADGGVFGQFVIAFGTANVQQVVEEPDHVFGSATIVRLHLDILRAPGYPGDDDELSTQCIEFWNTYIEYVNDVSFSKDVGEPDPLWLDHAKSALTELLELLWAKMCMPPGDVVKAWGAAESEGFKDFRLDANDLMLSVYVCLGQQMLQRITTYVLHWLAEKQWLVMEAGLYCLNALADNVLEDQPSEDVLATVFGSSLYREIGDFALPIPAQTRRTAIDMLASYGQYIERHAEYLPDTLRFLFASLETETFAATAARSIASLCATCRVSLTGELEGFLQQYQHFLLGPTSDPYTKEKVIGAIAAIVQALPQHSSKVPPLMSLLDNVDNDVQTAKQYAAAGDTEMAALTGVTALNCLASIGKGMQVPEDVPVNLYDDDDQTPGRPSFWDGEQGRSVQDRIMRCFSVLEILGNNGEAIEAACNVLRTGFAEIEPGPFVLPPSVTVSFLQQCSLATPQLESVLSTACTLITQHSRSESKRITAEASTIYRQVVAFAQQLGSPSQDPGVAQSCIDVFCRLLPYYTNVLLNDEPETLSTALIFSLQAIDGQDPFPKRSAAELWVKVIKTGPSPENDKPRTSIRQVMQTFGPQLAQSLMGQFGGLAQRSELDQLCEPLKALLATQPASKVWLESALTGSSFPETSQLVGDAEKRRFLQQLSAARGDGRKLKDVVREFWAACRGTVSSYAS